MLYDNPDCMYQFEGVSVHEDYEVLRILSPDNKKTQLLFINRHVTFICLLCIFTSYKRQIVVKLQFWHFVLQHIIGKSIVVDICIACAIPNFKRSVVCYNVYTKQTCQNLRASMNCALASTTCWVQHEPTTVSNRASHEKYYFYNGIRFFPCRSVFITSKMFLVSLLYCKALCVTELELWGQLFKKWTRQRLIDFGQWEIYLQKSVKQ